MNGPSKFVAGAFALLIGLAPSVVTTGTGALDAARAAPPLLCGQSGKSTSFPDIDGDGVADVVIGVPGDAGGRGAVDLRLSSGPHRLVTRASVPGIGARSAGDRFGSAVEFADLDRDQCTDLVIGASGEAGTGAVHVIFGSPTGLRPTGAVTIRDPRSTGEHFGSALAVISWNNLTLLRVGAPDRTVAGRARAGTVVEYAIGSAHGVATHQLRRELTENSPGVPGTAEVGDRFGEVLSGDGVGVPHEDVGAAVDAGAVVAIGRPGASSRTWTQNTSGVPGSAEAGDHFGAALSSSYDGLLIGVPGEDLGSLKNAGEVQLLRAGKVRTITQDSVVLGRAVPGSAEAGDEFGAAVYGGFLREPNYSGIAVGAPGEDIGTGAKAKRDAGVVDVIELNKYDVDNPHEVIFTVAVTQAGAAETGDRFGAALTGTRGDFNAEDHESGTLLVGAPGEDVGSLLDAGTVSTVRLYAPVGSVPFGRSGGSVAGLHYGAVVPNLG